MQNISRRAVILGAAAITAGCAAQGTPRFAAPAATQAGVDTTAIDQVLRQAVGPDKVAGVVATAATDKGTFYEAAFGKRDLDAAADMTPDTVFWIASMTKAITCDRRDAAGRAGQAAARRADRRRPARAEIAAQVLEGFDADGQAASSAPPKRPITLRHLLTHTAGFSYDDLERRHRPLHEGDRHPGIGTGKLEALKLPLLFDPGERWEYGINIDWAGKAVERVSGQSLDGYLREHIFTPLGMTRHRLQADARPAGAPGHVHARQPDGSLKPIDFEMPAGAGVLHGRRRPLLDRPRLPDVPARCSCTAASSAAAQILKPGDRRDDEQEPDGRPQRQACSRPPSPTCPTTPSSSPAWSRNGARPS